MDRINTHKELEVFKLSYKLAMGIFKLTLDFPKEERYSLTDQIRRSSRSVSVNIGELWRKRKYPKNFVSKIIEIEGEASETQIWLSFSKDCGYITEEVYIHYDKEYDKVLGMLVNMRNNKDKWTF